MIFLLNSNPPSVNGSSDSGKTDDGHEAEPTIEVDDLKLNKVFEGFKFPTSMAFLGSDDILVLEKNNGTVQRLLHGKIVEEPVLDVSVANYVERGMLGIAIDNKNTSSKYDDRYGRTPYVFLYYTESSDENNTLDENGDGKDCELCNPIGHRLYRYELHDDKLVNPQLLLDIPSNPGLSGSSHIGGALVIGPDNNIYLTTGDGESCQDNSCKDGIQNKTTNAQTANVLEGRPPEGRGGILRVDQDGRVIEGIFSDKYPLNLYYAIGIRNSFGIDFDPVTGNLWDTENGPTAGDEINMVYRGFNSGWALIQGFSKNDFMGTGATPYDLVYFGKGSYSEPKFSWVTPIGVTALEFLNSSKLGTGYQNNMFVGDINNGLLYRFILNEARNDLSFDNGYAENTAPLADREVNDPKENQPIVFGQGFGGITDLQTGPDGYLYVLSYTGSLFRILPSTSSTTNGTSTASIGTTTKGQQQEQLY